jgi:integrase/recombinase XerD
MIPVGSTARQAIARYLAQRGPGQPDEALFLGRRGEISARGLQHMLLRLKGRVGVTGRLSPHSLRHTFARSYLVNGGDVFSLQRILGHTTLDMVKRYVALADVDLVIRHSIASPADRLTGQAGKERPAAARCRTLVKGIEAVWSSRQRRMFCLECARSVSD